jgi:hypothetical protein
VQAGGLGLPTLPAQSIAARGSREIEKLGMPLEDWFESSLPTEHDSGNDIRQPGVPAQLIHASLIHADLKVLDRGLSTGEITPGQPLSIYGADTRPLTHPLPTAEALTTKATLGWNQTEQLGMNSDDQLMREIPLLFAPVPIQTQQESMGVGFKAVVVNGMLMSGAILAVILLTTLDLKGLSGIEMTVLTVLAAIGTLYLFLRRVRRHRR